LILADCKCLLSMSPISAGEERRRARITENYLAASPEAVHTRYHLGITPTINNTASTRLIATRAIVTCTIIIHHRPINVPIAGDLNRLAQPFLMKRNTREEWVTTQYYILHTTIPPTIYLRKNISEMSTFY
jgi:hypothetical protein